MPKVGQSVPSPPPVLTEEGVELYRSGREVVEPPEQIERRLKRTPVRLSRLLRVGMNTPLSTHVVMPALAAFVQRHPELRVDLRMLNRPSDLQADLVLLCRRRPRVADRTSE